MKHVKFAFASAALLAILAAVFVVRARQSPSAQDIFKRMANTYATCRTYRDEGAFTMTAKFPNAKQFYNAGTFTTALVQPDRCRIAVFSQSDGETIPSVVWRNGKESRFWNGFDRTDEAKDFLMALIACRAGDASYTQAFLSHNQYFDLDHMARQFERITDAKTDGEDCYRLQTINQVKDGKSVKKFYISKSTFLLRKMEYDSENKIPDAGVATGHAETRWKPVINKDIPVSALEYNPPR